MSRDRFHFGEYITDTPQGRVVDRLALVLQRRFTRDGKHILQVIACPYCGDLHTHSDGAEFRVPHCRGRQPFSGEYYILACDEPPLPASAPYPKA